MCFMYFIVLLNKVIISHIIQLSLILIIQKKMLLVITKHTINEHKHFKY